MVECFVYTEEARGSNPFTPRDSRITEHLNKKLRDRNFLWRCEVVCEKVRDINMGGRNGGVRKDGKDIIKL